MNSCWFSSRINKPKFWIYLDIYLDITIEDFFEKENNHSIFKLVYLIQFHTHSFVNALHASTNVKVS